MLKLIAAIGERGELGKDNKLLFNLPTDMKYFKEKTINSFVICGARTLESFSNKKPLKNRITFVLCGKEKYYDNCIVYHNFENLLHDVQIISKLYDVWVIGGGQIYKLFLPYCDELYLTHVYETISDATTYFPIELVSQYFELETMSDILVENNYKFKFCKYIKSK